MTETGVRDLHALAARARQAALSAEARRTSRADCKIRSVRTCIVAANADAGIDGEPSADDAAPGLAEAAPHYHGHRERLRERFREAGADALPITNCWN